MPSLQGRRGSLYVRLDVAVPTTLTDDQRLLLEDFGRQAGPEAYGRGTTRTEASSVA